MRIFNFLKATPVASFIFVIASAPGYADHATLEIHNNTSEAIMSFYATPTYQDNWGRERLGSDSVLPPGYKRSFDLSDGITDNCFYDLKIIMQSGEEIIRRRQDVCRKVWTISE